MEVNYNHFTNRWEFGRCFFSKAKPELLPTSRVPSTPGKIL